jgi:hypothetical protein
MIKVTRQGLANSAAYRWKKQYYKKPFQSPSTIWIQKGAKETHELLVALGDIPDPDEVDKTIGNKSWTNQSCDNCSEYASHLVMLNGVACDEYGETSLCLQCIIEAHDLLNESGVV